MSQLDLLLLLSVNKRLLSSYLCFQNHEMLTMFFQILLDELGFDENFLDPFLKEYIKPLSSLIFPSKGGCSLDSYKAFTVKYKMGDDLSLSYHYDNAEVTLNVCVGKDFTEGNLYFGDIKEVSCHVG